MGYLMFNVGFLCGLTLGMLYTRYKLSGSSSRAMYGYTWDEYNAMNHSQQENARRLWKLDNDKEAFDSIEKMYEDIFNETLTLQKAKDHLKKLKLYDFKYNHDEFSLKFELQKFITDNTPKEVDVTEGK
jgi:hypothetical protein